MAADLYKMQDDQRFPEIRIDKPEFVGLYCEKCFCIHMTDPVHLFF